MKLRELDIEHYGIFSGYRIDFHADGLQLVFGPNEAGKSTLLQLIRELLFGFPLRNRYAFDDHPGEMAATALIEMSNGTQYRFRRRKGRTKEVVGENLTTGDAIDATSLAGILGGAGGELFQHVFGFSLTELAAGEQSLRDARLSEALYGGALGGLASFQSVLRDLEKDHEQLFSPAATKRPINQLLGELKRLGKELRAAQVRPHDYEMLAREVERLDQTVVSVKQQRDELQRQVARTMKLVQAHQLWHQQAQLQAEIAALQAPADFPRHGEEQVKNLQTQRDQIASELDEFRQEIEDTTARLTSLSPRAELIAKAAEIQRLAQQLDMIRGFRRDLGLRRQESKVVKDRVASQLRDLDPDWTLEHLGHFRTSLARRTAVEEMQSELDRLEAQSRELLARRRELATDTATMRARLEELVQELVAKPLSDLVERAPAYEAHRQKLSELQEQSRELAARIAALETRLNAPFGHRLKDLRRLPVPLRQSVSEFRPRFLAASQSLDRCEQNLQRATDDLARCRDEMAALQASADVPDREQLSAARARRDQGWRLVRRRYVDRADGPREEIEQWLPGPTASLPDAYEMAVREADSVADQRQSQAEFVARQDQMADEYGRLEQQVGRATDARNTASARLDACRQDWQMMWRPAGIEPDSPDAMLEWLRLWEELLETAAMGDSLQTHAAVQQAAVDEYEAALEAVLPGVFASPCDRLAEARRRDKRAQEASAERKSYEAQLLRKHHQLAMLDRELAELQQQREAWHRRCEPLMAELGFPAEWDVHMATKVLNGLSEARREYEQAEALDRRAADMAQGLAAFDRDVRALCQELAASLLSLPPESALEELGRLLDQAREDELEQRNLSQLLSKLKTRYEAKRQQGLRAEASIEQLCVAAGADSEPELCDIARRVRRRHDLGDKVEAIDHQLRAIRGSEDAEAFSAALAAEDMNELESRRRSLEIELERMDSEFHVMLEQRGVAVDRLRGLDAASQAAAVAQTMESTRSQLCDAVERWAPLVLARAFMQRALQHFEREHQPQILVDVGRLFQRLTLGRYTELSRRLDEQGTLLVRQADGRLKEPDQLSTGTREQLYLAIRLAYVLHYCRQAEPLPIVMDDVLVNFDDRRAAQTLDTLIDIGDRVQVILLTCHQSTLDLVRSRLPELTPTELVGAAG